MKRTLDQYLTFGAELDKIMDVNNHIKIEKMTAKDIDTVYTLNLEIFEDDPWPIEWFIEGVNDPEGYYFLAYCDNKLVGYCGMYHITNKIPNYCKIATLGVKREFRLKGISKMLLLKMLNTAKELGLTRTKLEVNTKNSAIKLYESLGFKIEELKKNYYAKSGSDAYILWHYSELTNEVSLLRNI